MVPQLAAVAAQTIIPTAITPARTVPRFHPVDLIVRSLVHSACRMSPKVWRSSMTGAGEMAVVRAVMRSVSILSGGLGGQLAAR